MTAQTATQRPGNAYHAGEDQALRSLAKDQHVGEQARGQIENDLGDASRTVRRAGSAPVCPAGVIATARGAQIRSCSA